ncbi:NUDIX hydrolase [Gordonia sp. TBRC 11910]|uniref:NUDIX hydrolase n=1 Tax=Gordonia asplenii TaxID=2725283 RepID=A0A848KTZ6_9ACTN|nr:NUDIX hydrolase [Gordonia asplenii]NMO00345.1 NUDIX hydrolase [Gordonia asplenii]
MEQSVVSVDVLALRFGNPEPGQLRFAVTPRLVEPFKGETALPGVLLRAGERLNDAARRAVATKLGIPDDAIVATGQLVVFDEPNRDPRGPTLSVAMWAVIRPESFIATGKIEVEWRSFEAVGELAFDHSRIVAEARQILATRMLWQDLGFTRAILGERFPATTAVAVTAALNGVRPDQGNLNRTMRRIPGLRRTEEHLQVRETGRPSAVWTW